MLSHPCPRRVLCGVHGPAGDQPDGDGADSSPGAQAGPADACSRLGEVRGAGEGAGSLLHPPETPPVLKTVLPGVRSGPLQGQQLWNQ